MRRSLRRGCEGPCESFRAAALLRRLQSAALLRRRCEVLAKALRTLLRNSSKRSLHRPNRSPAKVGDPSCCQCLPDGRRNLLSLRRSCEGAANTLAKLLRTLSTSPQPLSCEGSCMPSCCPVPTRWATQPALTAKVLRRRCEHSCETLPNALYIAPKP